jgi:hypothetical protein
MRFAPTGSPSHLSLVTGGFTYRSAHMLGPGQPPPGTHCLPASPHRSPTTGSGRRHSTPRPEGLGESHAGLVSPVSALAVRVGYGNINPLSIDYACRPRLRPRLTLGGTAWPRNPWSIGATDSHSGYRYSCLHSHSRALHPWLTPRLHRTRDAPLPNTHPAPGLFNPDEGAPFGARC